MPNETAPEHLRLFLALTVPEDVKSAIERAQKELRSAVSEGLVRWTRREQFHLTLRFLGNVAAERLRALQDSTRKACAGFGPFQARAQHLGFFPERGLPRVVWVGIQDREARLLELQRLLQDTMIEFSAEAPEKTFTGHVTLGRIKKIRRPQAEALTSAVASLRERVFGEWTVSTVELMRSELSSAGALHTTLATLPLDATKPLANSPTSRDPV